MKIIASKHFTYRLVEDEQGNYVFHLVVPAVLTAAAVYEKQVILPTFQKWMVKLFPHTIEPLGERLIAEEKARAAKAFARR
ncbi:MAG TPA: hypothetical protein DCX52_05560 [Massilia sp.]|nr:hypothetical protein [Massilia sp.]